MVRVLENKLTGHSLSQDRCMNSWCHSNERTRKGNSSHKPLAHRNRSDFCDCDCDAHRGPQKSLAFLKQETAMMHCDLRVRWKVASDLRFRAAISEPKTPSLCGISGDLAPSTRKSLAIAIGALRHKHFQSKHFLNYSPHRQNYRPDFYLGCTPKGAYGNTAF